MSYTEFRFLIAEFRYVLGLKGTIYLRGNVIGIMHRKGMPKAYITKIYANDNII